jgi:membrane associated rhomboid family serine protease
MTSHRDFTTFQQDTDFEPDEVEEVKPDEPEDKEDHKILHEFRYYMDSLRTRHYWPEALTILGLCILGYVLTFGINWVAHWLHNKSIENVADFFLYGGMMSEKFWHGQFWRPLTSGFLHGGLWHILGNMISLLSLAFILRLYAPGKRWVWIFLLTQYFGCILASYFDGRDMVGASVGIMGLLGALLAAMIRMKFFKKDEQPPIHFITMGTLIMLMGLQIVMESLIPNVGHMGHASGFVLGFIAGMFVSLRGAVQVHIIGDHLKVNAVSFGKKDPYPVESIYFDVLEGFDRNKECIYSVHKLHTFWGGHRGYYKVLYGSRSFMLKHRGKGKLIARRFSLPGWANGEKLRQAMIRAAEKANHASTLPRLQRSAAYLLSWVPGGYAWYYLFNQWAGELRMDPASLQWVNHVLPAIAAPYAIDALSMAGCAMMTFFFAQMVQTFSHGFATTMVVRVLGNGRPAAAAQE